MTEVVAKINQVMLISNKHVSVLDSSGSSSVSSSSSSSSVSQLSNITAEANLDDSDRLRPKVKHQLKVPTIKDTWKYSIANSMSFLKNQRNRGHRDLIINNFLTDNNRANERSNSIDFSAIALKFTDSHLKDVDNVENSSFQVDKIETPPGAFSNQAANKSVVKIIFIRRISGFLIKFVFFQVLGHFMQNNKL